MRIPKNTIPAAICHSLFLLPCICFFLRKALDAPFLEAVLLVFSAIVMALILRASWQDAMKNA